MNKLLFFILFIFSVSQLRAQDDTKQITVGGGAGFETARAGNQINKLEIAYFGNVSYYFNPYIDIKLQVQGGKLTGNSFNYFNDRNQKNFTNNYLAVFLEGDVQAGMFFDESDNIFLNASRGLYVGVGAGLLNNKVTNSNFNNNAQLVNSVNSTSWIVPIKLGYEVNLITQDGQPQLKIDGSYSFNYTTGKGLDGYSDKYSLHFKYFNYYSIGLKYVFTITGLGSKHLTAD
ncbi:MAG: hypothetical protein JWP44_141 [Mucilaginibacter sp.]|nr:hypothetical protein [Mucilaginibacter sp.]